MRVLRTASGEVLGLAFSPDGRALAAAVEHQGVFLWNLESAGPPVKLDGTATYRARDLYFSPDSRSVGWLGWTGWRVYDRDTRTTAAHRLDSGGQPYRLIPSSDPDRVFSQHKFPESVVVGWHRTAAGWARGCEISMEQLAIEGVTV